MSNTQLTLNEEQPVALSPMQMIQKSLDAALASGDNGLQVASLILDQMAKQRDYEDRERFSSALRRIQDDLKSIKKRGWNPDTKSHFALPEDIDAQLNGLLKREGMTLSFEPRLSEKPEEVIIVGILSLGAYAKEYPLPMPADGKGAKGGGVMSRTHATGSAVTYGKRYLKDMIFNLSLVKDDDGDGASGAGERMTESVLTDWLDTIKSAATQGELTANYIRALKAASAQSDKQAIEGAANRRKKELAK